MRDYELVLIFHPVQGEEAILKKLERFHALLTDEGTEIKDVNHWGSRKLAYPIRKQTIGYYVVTQFTGEPGCLPELERIMKLDEGVLRYLIVLGMGEPSSGMSVLAPPFPSSDDEEDEEEEQEEEDDPPVDTGGPPEFSGGRGHRRRLEGPPIEILNYKDVGTLSRFVTEQGKLLPRRTTRVTAKFQRKLGRAVKRARYLALLPYMGRHQG